MRKKRGKFIALAVSLGMFFSMTACGNSTNSTEGENTETSAGETVAVSRTESEATVQEAQSEEHEPVSLRFMWWGGDERAEATLAVIDQFQESYPWITIEAEYGSDDGYLEKLTSQLNAGTEADIIQVGPGWMPSFVDSGGDYFVDFFEYEDFIDISGFEEGFLNENGIFDGHLYGLPTGLAGSALIYNESMASELGVDMTGEMTWNDLIEKGKQVREKDSEKYLLSMDSSMLNAVVFLPYMQQLTGKLFFDNDTYEMTFSREELIEGLEFIKSLYDNEVCVPISSVAAYGAALQTDPNWISGDTYVGVFCYTSTCETYTAACEGAEFHGAYLPKLENAKADGYVSDCPQFMCVSKKSDHIEEAIMFLDYFYNNEEAAKTLGTVRSMPPTRNAQQVCSDNGLVSEIVAETVNICQEYNGIKGLGLVTYEEANTLLEDMLLEIAYGESAPEEAADKYIPLFQNFLDAQKNR